jgi:hypothetical protein
LPLVVIIGIQTATEHPGDLPWALLAVAIVIALLAVYSFDFFAQTSVSVADGLVRRTGVFGRSTTCRLADVGHVIEAPTSFTSFASPERWLWLMDAEGRTLMRVYAPYYRFRDIERLKSRLDVPWDYNTGYRRLLDFRRAHPGSVPWPMAHYWVTFLGVLGAAALLLRLLGAVVQAA